MKAEEQIKEQTNNNLKLLDPLPDIVKLEFTG
jgi:hypothetical protein